MNHKEDTPRANRFHIGLFGRRNAGKSSLVNALTGQDVAVVSEMPGTTTDAVYKNMELPEVGASVWVDTAGYDDIGELGALRVEQTLRAARRVDVALLVVSGAPSDTELEKEWLGRFREEGIPVLLIYNKVDVDGGVYAGMWGERLGMDVLCVSARTGEGLDALRDAVADVYRKTDDAGDLTGSLVKDGDVVLLVMPQDIQAPKGRLILPQVQTLRNLLDKKCLVLCCTTGNLQRMLDTLSAPPTLLITDSQVFRQVEQLCPPQTLLTSFSVLFARQKGDIRLFMAGAEVLMNLRPDARILIAEACTHVPRNEDIGRVKLPRLLRGRFGDSLQIDIVSGDDFPDNPSGYDLIIHCGACMFTRRHVLNRLRRACACSVPVTNYGMAIAALNGILHKIALP